ncbi:MAG TPA: dTDP-4-dehydrorhamnose reductase [Actinomycetes bacterium]|nr:dTDP-4-dehydrorhamnose reductase [Actinomycetes bacterium]
MTHWLVIGGAGMLGRELTGLLDATGAGAISLGHAELDVTDAGAVDIAVQEHRPAVVVNCAAWTAVDDAEAHEPQALRVNGAGAGNVARACARTGVPLVQISTDYVFDGRATQPYSEEAGPQPRTAYGRTKLAGERAVRELLPELGYVVRTAWLYGEHGPNFVRTMIELAGRRPTVDVVADQVGQPTWTRDLAGQLIALVGSGAPAGIYHGTNAGRTSWYGLARQTFALLGADPDRVRPTQSAAYPRPAQRPAFSVLGHDGWAAAGLPAMRDWRAALAEAFPALLTAATRAGAG